MMEQYVDRYNYARLHSTIAYVTPKDMLAGRRVEIHTERDCKQDAVISNVRVRHQQAE